MYKILHIEDSKTYSYYIKHGLERLGFSVKSFEDIKDINCVDDCDCVILDLDLNETKGIDTVLECKKKIKNLPIIVLSGRIDDYIKNICLSLGVKAFLNKRNSSSKNNSFEDLKSVILEVVECYQKIKNTKIKSFRSESTASVLIIGNDKVCINDIRDKFDQNFFNSILLDQFDTINECPDKYYDCVLLDIDSNKDLNRCVEKLYPSPIILLSSLEEVGEISEKNTCYNVRGFFKKKNLEVDDILKTILMIIKYHVIFDLNSEKWSCF